MPTRRQDGRSQGRASAHHRLGRGLLVLFVGGSRAAALALLEHGGQWVHGWHRCGGCSPCARHDGVGRLGELMQRGAAQRRRSDLLRPAPNAHRRVRRYRRTLHTAHVSYTLAVGDSEGLEGPWPSRYSTRVSGEGVVRMGVATNPVASLPGCVRCGVSPVRTREPRSTSALSHQRSSPHRRPERPR